MQYSQCFTLNMLILILGLLASVSAGTSTDNKESYKNQHCTDPRTMKKHPAYTEWADAYSCTRHRCQPGGRNLAIYTVGCKRVEAPESAIECEEVVEDTNMQFPFCCTRLRCLVVVRGEVWTRVLGQPWEVLPAAPWSHMYKMKKPPPADSTLLPKSPDQGPVYELSESESDQGGHDKVLRSGKKPVTDSNDFNDIAPVPRAVLPPPDIVIALSTNEETKESSTKLFDSTRHGKRRQSNAQPPPKYFEKEVEEDKRIESVKEQEADELPASTEKPFDDENEKFFDNTNYADTQKTSHKSHKSENTVSWTEIPQNQWNEPKEGADIESRANEHNSNYQPQDTVEPKQELVPTNRDQPKKPTNLQALVDAIGTRMRDIENVVQKMSNKVHQAKTPAEGSNEKRMPAEQEGSRMKRPSTEYEKYKRFTMRNERVSKYLRTSTDSSTEKPLIFEDTNLNGYFSDTSNSVLRRSNLPKEPPPLTYMAPVENRRKMPVHIAVPDYVEDKDKKRKKHTHKKRRGKGSHSHKKHSHAKDDKRKRFNRLSSGELEKNAVSLEDSSDLGQ